MKVVFHPDYHVVYAGDPAAERGRLKPIVALLEKHYPFVEPQPATIADIARVHTPAHIDHIKADRKLFKTAMLAAGGAIQASRLAVEGEPAFALIRPPGHHASPDSCWGFCFFNNMAVALRALLAHGLVETAVVLDIDLHFGDGTVNAFRRRDGVFLLNPEGARGGQFARHCRTDLEQVGPVDVVAVCAGFDRHLDDWGGELLTDDYRTIGELVKEHAERHCGGRRFAILEGGYNPEAMAEGALALLEGMA